MNKLSTTERETVIDSGQTNNREDIGNRHGHTKWKCHTHNVFSKDNMEEVKELSKQGVLTHHKTYLCYNKIKEHNDYYTLMVQTRGDT
eukprot:8507381-Heterocapsa_arctica.AAC.1